MVDIEIKNLTKSFNNDKIFENLNLKIKKNELCVLLGPSGCGKTTLLEIISGLQNAEGEIFFNNENVTKKLPNDREISMIFQNYALYPNMNVYKNVEFPLKIKKVKRKERKKRVIEILSLVNLHNKIKSPINILSGGEKQRVAIARAIISNPKVFLMDEPLSNLDIHLKSKVRKEIVKLHKQLQTTTIYVTHDQNEAINIADKIVLLDKGTVKQVGTVDEILFKPKNLFVFEFFNQNNSNKLNCEEYFLLFNKKIENNKIIAFKSDSLFESKNGIKCIIEDIELFEHYKILKVKYKNITLLYSTNLQSTHKLNDNIYLQLKHDTIHIFDKV